MREDEIQTVDEALAAQVREEGEPAPEPAALAEEGAPLDRLHDRARKLSPEGLRTLIEALLLVAEKPLTLDQVREVTGLEPQALREAFDALGGRYREGPSGIVLQEVAGGWQLRTDPVHADFVRRFLAVKPQRLTRAALETLAITAYRQPVTRPEVEQVRGVDSGAVLAGLLERRLVKILGKKDEPGRPLLYGTTREFLEFFALKDLASLPTLREFHELTEEHREIVQEVTGEEEPRPIAALADNALERMLAERSQAGEEALAALDMAIHEAEVRTREAEAALGAPAEGEAAAPEPPPTIAAEK